MISYFSELIRFKELLWALTLREIKIRYKQTILGVVWAILQPASLTIIFTVVFSLFLKVSSQNAAYPIFVYSALLPWTFFTNAVTFGSLSVVNNGNLVTKVYFPREILPFASVGAAFFDFIMASIIFIILILVYKIPINISWLYLLFVVPLILLLTSGIALFLSALNVLYRDIRFIVPLAVQIWLYVTPVIYSLEQVPDRYKFLILLNPVTPLVQTFRDITVFSKLPEFGQLSISAIVSTLIFLIGLWFFKLKSKIFADVI